MSLPSGSVEIAGIDTSSYTYLVNDGSDNAEIAYTWDSQYFSSKGKPNGNLSTVDVPEQLLLDIRAMLPERSNNGNSVFDDYPDLTDPDTDYSINISQETDIMVTFLDEGAGYKNSLGYYFWVDDNGTKKILSNDQSTNSNGSIGHYNPTIIFPNASLGIGGSLKSGGGLVPGHKRTLKGNLANGKFNNVNVSFFVVPNGWKSHSQGIVYNNKPIIYGDRNMNEISNGQSEDLKIQSILFNYEGQLLIAFEDIKRPGGDSDFNDLIIKVETTPGITGNFINSLQGVMTSEVIKKDFFGMYISDKDRSFTGSNKKYRLKRNIKFSNQNRRDKYKFILERLNNIISPTITEPAVDELCIEYDFESTDIDENKVDDELKLYLFKKESNEEDETVIVSGHEFGTIGYDFNDNTVYDLMVSMQHLEIDEVVSEDHIVTDVTDTNSIITIQSNNNATVDNVNGSLFAWGDPHIKTVHDNIVTVGHEGVFELFNDTKLVINMECWKHPLYANHHNKDFREGTFIKNIAIICLGQSYIINMDDLSIKNINGNVVKNDTNDTITVSKVNDFSKNYREFKYVILGNLNKDPKSRTVFVKTDKYTFACITYPSLEGVLNEFRIVKCNHNNLPSNSKGIMFNTWKELGSLC
jgi:hypothetical protein